MNRRACLLLVGFAACSQSQSSPPIVTEAVWHLEIENRVVAGEIGPAAVTYLSDFAAEHGMSAEEEWAVLQAAPGGDGLRHVRLQQLHRGVPVLQSEVSVHADDSTFLAYAGTVTRNLEGFAVEPRLEAAQAMDDLKQLHAEVTAAPADIIYEREASRLAIRPRAGEGADLVWQLELLNDAQEGVEPGRWFALVDATTAEVLDAWNGLATAEQASGPGGNPKVARAWTVQLDVEPMDGQFGMRTDRLETYDMKHGDNHGPVFDHFFGGNGELVKGPLDPIGDAAINDAHGYTEITLDMMRQWMGHNSIDDKGMVIVSRVHYGNDFKNAFWDGKRMTYGDGGDSWYPFSGSVDVVAHEVNHGFTEKHSGLNYKGMSGGLNESFSDIAGTITEFYLESIEANAGSGDFLNAEDIKAGDGSFGRSLCDPPADGRSIDHVSQFDEGFYLGKLRIKGTDVHHSSGLGNKAFCLAATRYAVNNQSGSWGHAVRGVGQAWYLANAGYWTSGSSFTQGCQGVVDAARALGLPSDDIVAIHQSWADVGIECEGGALVCNANGSCDVGDGESCFSCATDCGSCREQCSRFKKAKCKLGIGDCSRCTDEEGCGDGACDDDETDVTCARDCGCSAPGDACGSVGPFGCYCDETCADNGDCCADVEVCQ